jgi:hypothetical protein
MAFKDIRSSVADLVSPPPVQDATDARIQRVFAELSQELGVPETENMPTDPAEEFTVVYDKFSGRNA